jgi:hypothetical protein
MCVAKDQPMRATLHAAVEAAALAAVVLPSDVAALLRRLSLFSYGAALCHKLGVASVSEVAQLTEADVREQLPAMKVAERRRLLHAAVEEAQRPAPTSAPHARPRACDRCGGADGACGCAFGSPTAHAADARAGPAPSAAPRAAPCPPPAAPAPPRTGCTTAAGERGGQQRPQSGGASVANPFDVDSDELLFGTVEPSKPPGPQTFEFPQRAVGVQVASVLPRGWRVHGASAEPEAALRSQAAHAPAAAPQAEAHADIQLLGFGTPLPRAAAATADAARGVQAPLRFKLAQYGSHPAPPVRAGGAAPAAPWPTLLELSVSLPRVACARELSMHVDGRVLTLDVQHTVYSQQFKLPYPADVARSVFNTSTRELTVTMSVPPPPQMWFDLFDLA